MGVHIQQKNFSLEQLEKFKAYQRRSYDILEAATAFLKPGVSEKETARHIRKKFHLAGARGYFHVPVVLFGDRTAYPGDFGPFEAISTDRTLKEGDAVIFDAAPIFDGFKVDTSYAFQFGDNPRFAAADRALREFRPLLLKLIADDLTFREVAWKIDDRVRELGFENCHKKHIGAVLGHRVSYAPQYPVRMPKIWGLAPRQVSWFLNKSLQSRLGMPAQTPNWNASRQCVTKPTEGLWAMEPHIAKGGVGVKFEEILVIDRNGARWLDDDLPHTRRWASPYAFAFARYASSSSSPSHLATVTATAASPVTLTIVRIMSRRRSNGKMKPMTSAVCSGVTSKTSSTMASRNKDADGTPAVPIETSAQVSAMRT